jgi:DNA-binding winged helix-turn-helix (wHTH) protein/Flp pilus assembly protein TadD
LNVSKRQLQKVGELIPITSKVFETLLVLVEHAGETVETDELMRMLWPNTVVEQANLTQNIFILRKLLGDSASHGQYIATIPRRGYRFTATVAVVRSAKGEPSAWPVDGLTAQRPMLWSAPRRRAIEGLLVGVAVALVAISIFGPRATTRVPTDSNLVRLRRVAPNEQAYLAYLNGRLLRARWSAEDVAASAVRLEQAVVLDPEYAPAHAALAKAYVTLYLRDIRAYSDAGSKAKAAALRSVALAPSSAEAHAALASVLLQIDGNWPAAERELQQALARNPNDVDAYDLLARGLRQRERFAESIRAARRQVQLDPLSARGHNNLAISLYQATHSYDEAISEARATLALDPTDAYMEKLLAGAYEFTGRYNEALEARQAFELLGHNPDLAAALGRDYHLVGFVEAMRRYSLSKVARLEIARTRGALDPWEFALASVRIGQPARAIDYLEQAMRVGYNGVMFGIAHDPLCHALVTDARFERLLERPSPIVGTSN